MLRSIHEHNMSMRYSVEQYESTEDRRTVWSGCFIVPLLAATADRQDSRLALSRWGNRIG
jgi:hypothetical protein